MSHGHRSHGELHCESEFVIPRPVLKLAPGAFSVAHRGNPPSVVAPPIVLVLETTLPVAASDQREPAHRCFATQPYPLGGFPGLASYYLA